MAAMTPRVLLRSERGAELIEMAVVLPLLLIVIFSIIDFGFLFQRYVVLTNAAMEGARVATLPGYSDEDAVARVQSYADNGGIVGPVNATVTAMTVPGPGGGTWPAMQVTATHVYTYQYIGPLASLVGGSGLGSVTLTARATMRSQVAAGP